VLSCDLLAPNPVAIAAVVDRLRAAAADVVAAVPVVDGHHQWTHMAWRRRALPALETARQAGVRSLQRACADLPLEEVTGLAAADVADADEPRDLPRAR
jgi:molybdopterin-guanine dinucleotide biosynthesis protein A